MQEVQVSRKRLQAQKTRRNILVAATKLFARQGYHKTTINDICREIHLTSGAVFHHFPSKETLLDEVIIRLERGMKIYSNFLNQAKERSSKVLIEIIGIMCDHYERQPEATICLASLATEFAGSNHHIEKRLKNIYEGFVSDLAGVLELHPGVTDPKAAAISFVGAVQGIAIQGLLREGEQSIRHLANGFLSILADW